MSTKSTLLYGKTFHVYIDGFNYLPTVEINGRVMSLPDEFLEALRDLICLHDSVKTTMQYTQKLDKIDGGLFSINLETGETKEFKGDLNEDSI